MKSRFVAGGAGLARAASRLDVFTGGGGRGTDIGDLEESVSSWRDDGISGTSGSSDPYQEMPSYVGGDEASPPDWDEPTERPRPPPGLLIPVSSLGEWFKRGVEVFKAAPAEFIVVQLIVLGVFSLSFGLLSGPIFAGYYRCALRRIDGHKLDVNDLFGALTDNFVPTFLAGLGLFAFSLGGGLIVLVLDLVAGTLPFRFMAVLARALIDLSASLSLAAGLGVFSLMLPMIHERGMRIEAAFKICMGMFQRNWLYAALFGIVVAGLQMIGLTTIIGILVAGPFSILVAAQAFRALFPGSSTEGAQTPRSA